VWMRRHAQERAEEDPSPRRSARRRRRRRGHGPDELGVWWTSPLGAGPFARVPYRSACRLTRWLICISARAKGPAPSGTSTTRLAPQARAHAFFSSGARSVVGSGPPPPCLGRAGRRASRVRVTPPAAAPSRPLHLRGRCTFAHARHLRACSSCRRSPGALSLGARGSCLCQDAMRVMQGPWTPRCYCTVADLSRCIASHFITRVCSPAVSTPHGPLPLAGPPELCTDPRPKHLPVSVAVSRVRAATRCGDYTHWSRPEQMLPQTCT